MKFALIFGVLWVVWYGLCTFISLEPNPTNWSMDGRFFFVIVGIFIIPLFSIIIRAQLD